MKAGAHRYLGVWAETVDGDDDFRGNQRWSVWDMLLS